MTCLPLPQKGDLDWIGSFGGLLWTREPKVGVRVRAHGVTRRRLEEKVAAAHLLEKRPGGDNGGVFEIKRRDATT